MAVTLSGKLSPSAWEYFCSFYYHNTYADPIDLSDGALREHMMEGVSAETARRLISQPGVRDVLSEPLTYDSEEIPRRNQVLSDRGFRLLSRKQQITMLGAQTFPYYSVVEHDELPGYVIKAGATRIQPDQPLLGPRNSLNEMAFFTREESLMRIHMAARIARIVHDDKIEGVTLPRKRLVAYDGATGGDPTRKYCVVCEKLDVPTTDETQENIAEMSESQQVAVARKICHIVQKAGLVDASFDNIRVSRDGHISIIDTEPGGLMASKGGSPARGASVEKCARIGLFTLLATASPGVIRGFLPQGAFAQEVKRSYDEACSPKLSKWKITASVLSLGLIPIIQAVIALVKSTQLRSCMNRLLKMDSDLAKRASGLLLMNSGALPGMLEEHRRKRTPLAKAFFAMVEGVPYDSQAQVVVA